MPAVRKWCRTEENENHIHVARLLVDLDTFIENVAWQVVIEANRVKDTVLERQRWYGMKDGSIVLIHTDWYEYLPTGWCLEFSTEEGLRWLKGSTGDYLYYSKVIDVYKDVSFRVAGEAPSEVLQLIPVSQIKPFKPPVPKIK
jgi:hypothetical protein